MTATTHKEVSRIAALLLRPLIRLLVHYGVGLSELVELVKHLYVEQATDKLAAERKRVTDASISVMTGLHRKDVRRISETPVETLEARVQPSLLTAVMELWTGDARFLDKRGAARPLKRRQLGKSAVASDEATFEDLIEQVTKGVPPKALLDEWLRLGAVALDEGGAVRWAAPEYASGEELQQLRRSFRTAADRVEASWHNLFVTPKRHFLFSVRGKHILEEDALRLDEAARRWGRRFGDRMNVLTAAAEARGKAEGGDLRYSMAVQSYAEPMDQGGRRSLDLSADAESDAG
jgi:hypothetical protein